MHQTHCSVTKQPHILTTTPQHLMAVTVKALVFIDIGPDVGKVVD